MCGKVYLSPATGFPQLPDTLSETDTDICCHLFSIAISSLTQSTYTVIWGEKLTPEEEDRENLAKAIYTIQTFQKFKEPEPVKKKGSLWAQILVVLILGIVVVLFLGFLESSNR